MMLLFFAALQAVISLHKSGYVECSDVQSGPIFIKEPIVKLDFLNTVGARLDCLAYGNPTPNITWFQFPDQKTKVQVHDVKNIIHTLKNGTLIFRTFSSDEYSPSVHASRYVCQASNIYGQIVSANVDVRASTEEQQQQIQAQVYDTYAMPGNTAILKCHVPTFLNHGLKVVAWVREDNLVIKSENPVVGYTIADDEGNLYIQDINRKMNLKLGYWCQVKNLLSGKTFLSQTAGRIIITVPQGGVKPTITHLPKRVYVDKESSFVVNCAVQGFPVPEVRWTMNALSKVLSTESSFQVKNRSLEGINVLYCKAQNRYGRAKKSVEVIVKEKLSASIRPSVLRVDNNKEASFECLLKGYPIDEVNWVFNGQKIINSTKIRVIRNSLHLSSVGRDQEGMYQCFAGNKWDSSQSTSQLVLESVAPQFTKTFESKLIQPGPSLTLKCAANGRPKPSIKWKFNGKPITGNQRLKLDETNLPNNSVESVLTVKDIITKDGGVYACIANNKDNEVEHSNKLSVFGLPYIHPLPNITIPAGEDTYVECYVSGYPIKTITWEKVGSSIIMQRNLKDYKNGTLMILKMDKNRDEGEYSCVVDNGRGQIARSTFHIRALAKPVIAGPTTSQKEIVFGRSFTTLCDIALGDGVIKIYWLKNGQNNILGKGIDVSTTKQYSVLQIRQAEEEHSGNYSCVAQNIVGKDVKSVILKILSAPKWISRPTNVLTSIGNDVVLKCHGNGYPTPKSEWYKITGEQVSKIGSSSINNEPRVDANGTLHIIGIGIEAAGNYSCVVSNGISPDLMSQSHIQVQNKASIVYMNESMSKTIGTQIMLLCKASGVGIKEIFWTKNDSLLNASNKWGISTDSEENTISSMLKFRVESSDNGQYNCNINSNRESRSKSLHLTILDSSSTYSYKKSSSVIKTTTSYYTTAYTQYSEAAQHQTTEAYLSGKDNMNDLHINENTGKTLHSKKKSNGEINFKAVMFIVPTAAVIVLLIAVIVTLVFYLVLRKTSRRPNAIRYSMDGQNTVGKCSRKAASPSSTMDRRYGKLEPPYPSDSNKRESLESNAYEIPDYYATSKPYATLQLSTMKCYNDMTSQNQSSL